MKRLVLLLALTLAAARGLSQGVSAGATANKYTASGGAGGGVSTTCAVNNQVPYLTGADAFGCEAGFTYDPSANTFTVGAIVLGGASGAGFLELPYQDAAPATPTAGPRLYADSLTGYPMLLYPGPVAVKIWNESEAIPISGGGTGATTAGSARTALGVQALDSDLSALAGNSTNGLWARTGTGAGSARTLTGTANEITITNGDGVSGNPTFAIASALDLASKTFRVPRSTTLPATCTVGSIYQDTDATAASQLYLCTATDTWTAVGSGGGGSGVTLQGSTPGTADTGNINVTGKIIGGTIQVGTAIPFTDLGSDRVTAPGLFAPRFSDGGTVSLVYAGDGSLFMGTSVAMKFTNDATYYGTVDGSVSRTGAGEISAGTGAAGSSAGVFRAARFRAALSTPSASSDSCNAGQIWVDASFVYVCTASNTIGRLAIVPF